MPPVDTIRSLPQTTDLSEYSFHFQQVMAYKPNSKLYGFFRDNTLVGVILFESDEFLHANVVLGLAVSQSYSGLSTNRVAAKLLGQVMLNAFAQPKFEGFVIFDTPTLEWLSFLTQQLHGNLQAQTVIFNTQTSQQLIDHYLKTGGFFEP